MSRGYRTQAIQRTLRELSPGDVLAGYRIESVLGRGGMGVVYRATNLALEQVEAFKVIAWEFAADEDFRERFKRESRIAASLRSHPNVITVYNAGEQDGYLFLAMALITGTDLRALLQREGRLRPQRALDLLA